MIYYCVNVGVSGRIEIERCEFQERRKVRYADTQGAVNYYVRRVSGGRLSKNAWLRIDEAVMRNEVRDGRKPRHLRLFK